MRIRRMVVALVFYGAVSMLTLGPAISQGLSRDTAPVARELPQQLSDQEFWQLINEFSETGGYFPSDNFVSNEIAFQDVIPELTKNTKVGGVYLGVGPEQNFTYMAAVQPRIAFIFDIRRQNMIQHLMYKALFELCVDRADFLSLLFSRPRPADVGANSTARELFAAFYKVGGDHKMFQTTLTAINRRLVEEHGFALTTDDQDVMNDVFETFFREGPDITYNGHSRRYRGMQLSPTYADLMIQTDGNQQNGSYIGSEQNFQFVRDLEKKNLVLPIVGDFSGEKAIRGVAQYIRDHDASVAAFYLSNVEEYLFKHRDAWSKFYSNVETLPIDSTSMLIRALFDGVNNGGLRRGRNRVDSISLLCPIEELMKTFKTGEIRRYYDAICTPR